MLNRKSLLQRAAERQFVEHSKILELNENQTVQISGGSLGTLIYGMAYSLVITVDATAGTTTSSMKFFDGYENPYDIFPEEEEESYPIA